MTISNNTRRIVSKENYNRAARICKSLDDILYLAWITWDGKCEKVMLSYLLPGGRWSSPESISTDCAAITQLCIAAYKDGVICVFVNRDNNKNAGLDFIVKNKDVLSHRLLVPSVKNPMNPCIAAFEESFCMTFCQLGQNGNRELCAISGNDIFSSFSVKTICDSGMNMCSDIVMNSRQTAVVWQRIYKNRFEIMQRTFSKNKVGDILNLTGEQSGICAMPTIADSIESGYWVAWQNDATPKPGLARYISLCHIDENQKIKILKVPHMSDRTSSNGEDQGFESPSLNVLDDGSLIILGRGSQSILKLEYKDKRWSSLEQVDAKGWACRSNKISSIPVRNSVFMAVREKADIAVYHLACNQLLQKFTKTHGDIATAVSPSDIATAVSPSDIATATSPSGTKFSRVLFGDIHQHTAQSDGTGTGEESYHRARYRYRDDFAAISDHESFLGKKTPPGQWQYACQVADEFNDPGNFTTLYAYEWTGKMHPGPGHKVVYPLSSKDRLFSRDHPDTSTSHGLIENCRRTGAVVIPHHVGWTGADMDNHNPEVQTAWEIVSCHGAYEKPGASGIGTRGDDKEGQFVSHALDRGLCFGFTGGSDGHGLRWHHGICRKEDSHRTGLTAVFAEPDRKSILNALKNRKCYATSGEKILLRFEIKKMPMGSRIHLRGENKAPFHIMVVAENPIKSLSIVTNGQRETQVKFKDNRADDTGFVKIPDKMDWAYFYVRVLLKNNEMAWSSPIWLIHGD